MITQKKHKQQSYQSYWKTWTQVNTYIYQQMTVVAFAKMEEGEVAYAEIAEIEKLTKSVEEQM